MAPASIALEEGLSIPPVVYERRVSTRIKAKKVTEVIEAVQETSAVLGKVDGEDSEDESLPEEDAPEPPKKRRRRTKVVEPVVYEISDVEKQKTTWKGVFVQDLLLSTRELTPLGVTLQADLVMYALYAF